MYWYPRLARGVERATAPLGRPGRVLERKFKGKVMLSGRFGRSVNVVSRVLRAPTVKPADDIPAEAVESCRGRASSLATNPDYAPYAVDYLNDR